MAPRVAPLRHSRRWGSPRPQPPAMFYLVTLWRDLDLHPKFFGRHLTDTVMQKLVSSVGGGQGLGRARSCFAAGGQLA